jgi:hypothetical protein
MHVQELSERILKSMVRSIAARAASWGLVLAAAFLPVAASAQETPSASGATVYHYSTSITPVYGSQYPIAGHLDLEVFPDGIVRGYYHNAFQKAYVQVAGGRDGTYLWFDIGPVFTDLGFLVGPNGKAHVVATMSTDNSFRGQIYPEATADTISSLANTPSAFNTADTVNANGNIPLVSASPGEQYVFAGKPIEKSPEDYPGT